MTLTRTRGVIALAALAVATSAASADLIYTFDTDLEGWGGNGDVQNLMWNGDIQGEAAIQADDITNGNIWYFNAPNADLGNFSGLYNNTISWDIIGLRGNQTSVNSVADVMLVGNGTQIGINIDVQPVLNQWTSWMVTVSATEDWRLIGSFNGGTLGAVVDAATIQGVLADLQSVSIRGEYTSGSDRAGLDNVHIVPAPAGVALFGVGALGLVRRKR